MLLVWLRLIQMPAVSSFIHRCAPDASCLRSPPPYGGGGSGGGAAAARAATLCLLLQLLVPDSGSFRDGGPNVFSGLPAGANPNAPGRPLAHRSRPPGGGHLGPTSQSGWETGVMQLLL